MDRKGRPVKKGFYWHDIGIYVVFNYTPQLKKPVLAVEIGNESFKVASFNDDEAAEWFLDKFAVFLNLKQEGKREV